MRPIKHILGMKRPKSVKPKNWQRHLAIDEMNRKIIKEKMKDSTYVLNPIDERLMDAGEYKANRKKK